MGGWTGQGKTWRNGPGSVLTWRMTVSDEADVPLPVGLKPRAWARARWEPAMSDGERISSRALTRLTNPRLAVKSEIAGSSPHRQQSQTVNKSIAIQPTTSAT